jgi:hypothetical protein
MAGPVIYRSQWSTVNANFTPLPGAMPEAVEHHTGGDGPGDDLIGWLRSLEAGEMARGDHLIALAYHWMVISGGPHDGTKIECRPWGMQGGATLDHNETSRAVCMSGNFMSDVPTSQALDSTAELWAEAIAGGYVAKGVVVRPHSDFFATACCGTNLKARLPDLNTLIAQKLTPKPPVDPKLISWAERVAKTGLRFGDQSPDVATLVDLLRNHHFLKSGVVGDKYGNVLRTGVYEFKLAHPQLGNTDGKNFGGPAALVLINSQ